MGTRLKRILPKPQGILQGVIIALVIADAIMIVVSSHSYRDRLWPPRFLLLFVICLPIYGVALGFAMNNRPKIAGYITVLTVAFGAHYLSYMSRITASASGIINNIVAFTVVILALNLVFTVRQAFILNVANALFHLVLALIVPLSDPGLASILEIGILDRTQSVLIIFISGLLAYYRGQIENQRAEVAAANTELRHFIEKLHHEIATPLNAIEPYTQILTSERDGELITGGTLNQRQRQYINQIQESSAHLRHLVTDLHDISRLQRGDMLLKITDVDLNRVIEYAIHTMEALIKPEVQVVCESHHLPSVQADETRIKQILLNIANNAAKFTDEGSITIQTEARHNAIDIHISDTGIGMTQEDQQTVFRRFGQSIEGRKRRGLGIGMTLAQELTHLHHGRLTFTSKKGTGTTFTLTLPLEQPPS